MSDDYVKSSKSELRSIRLDKLKESVEKEAWVALRQYFDGAGNGPEAKIAVVVIGTVAKEKQSDNNKRQLDLVERRMKLVS